MGGNALRRFQSIQDENSVFKFSIDTSKIDPLGTDGSENPLTFKIPMPTASGANNMTACIIKISDGRPDISVIGNGETGTKTLLTFASSGVYDIEIIGRVQSFGFYSTNVSYDRLKIISVTHWGSAIGYGTRAFYNCVNLEINASNTLKLPASPSWFFQNIKAFNQPLTLIDTSIVTDAGSMLGGISQPLPTTLNPFFNSLISVNALYGGVTFGASVNKVEIISNSITSLSQPWNSVTFQNTGSIELICNTPNLTTMFRVFYSGEVRTRCHAGKIDVRNVTSTDSWLTGTMSVASVNATLIGWASLPSMKSGVTWNWNGSKYSNNPTVLAALNKITSDWGVIFTGLTME